MLLSWKRPKVASGEKAKGKAEGVKRPRSTTTATGNLSVKKKPKQSRTELDTERRVKVQHLVDWCSNEKKVNEWVQKVDLGGKLGPRITGGRGVGPLVFIEDVLPSRVAEGARAAIQLTNKFDWEVAQPLNDTRGGEDYGAGSTNHRFRGADGSEILQLLYVAMNKLLPTVVEAGLRPGIGSFAAGCYLKGDFIEAHDDAAYKDIPNPQAPGLTMQVSRDVAVILYLCKNWTKNDGGLFVDYGDKGGQVRSITPQFNSMAAFRVPRLHEVTPVESASKKRYSIFGWFMSPGQLYPLAGGTALVKKSKTRHKKKPKKPNKGGSNNNNNNNNINKNKNNNNISRNNSNNSTRQT